VKYDAPSTGKKGIDGRMRIRKSEKIDYATKYSRKWRSEGRTIAKLKAEGYVVFRIAHTQRRKHREFGTEIPREATLIAMSDDNQDIKLILVHSGKALPKTRRDKLLDFLIPLPIDAEIWTWPTLAREPEIERI
jgi:hypothetical protein